VLKNIVPIGSLGVVWDRARKPIELRHHERVGDGLADEGKAGLGAAGL
jgi:hypothetical protein